MRCGGSTLWWGTHDVESVAVDARVHAVKVQERVRLRLCGRDGGAVALLIRGHVLGALKLVVGHVHAGALHTDLNGAKERKAGKSKKERTKESGQMPADRAIRRCRSRETHTEHHQTKLTSTRSTWRGQKRHATGPPVLHRYHNPGILHPLPGWAAPFFRHCSNPLPGGAPLCLRRCTVLRGAVALTERPGLSPGAEQLMPGLRL